MKLMKHLVVAASAFAMTASPAFAADSNVDQARASTPVAQTEQLEDEDGGGGWILYALLGIALAAGLVLALDDPASP